MADKPLATRDLVESILELRGEVERRLMRNKYYLAIRKLDELLEAIRPLEADVIEEGESTDSPASLTSGTAGRDVPLQQRLTAETPPAPQRYDWDRGTTTSASEPAQHAKHESDWSTGEQQSSSLDDTLVLDERHERPSEPASARGHGHSESAELLADDDEQFMYRADAGA